MDGDFASGGSGDDKIYGSATLGVKENLFGGTGNDIIKSYDGDDRVYGGPGHDTIEVGADDNYIEGGDGND